MRPSYGGPGSARSTWKPNQDPGKQAPAASTSGQRDGKADGHRPAGNATHGQQPDTEEKKQ